MTEEAAKHAILAEVIIVETLRTWGLLSKATESGDHLEEMVSNGLGMGTGEWNP